MGSELEEIFRDAPAAPNAVANTHVRDAYAQALGKAVSSQASSSAEKGQKKRVPGPDDDCPVCYETMHGVQEKQLSYCEACGNCLHKDCFQQCKFQSTRRNANRMNIFSGAKSAKNLTCVWCRAPWTQAGATGAARAAGGSATTSEGYLNLSGVAGVSPVRDTSSCKIHALHPSSRTRLTVQQIIKAREEASVITVTRITKTTGGCDVYLRRIGRKVYIRDAKFEVSMFIPTFLATNFNFTCGRFK